MSAVATKPRSAKKAGATGGLSSASPLEQVLNALREVDQKLEDVYDAIEQSSDLEIILDLITHDLLVEAVQPLRGTELTKGSVAATHGALFTPLAVLQAAVALASGTAIQLALIDAHQLLDWAHNELDGANLIARSLPGAAKTTRKSTVAASVSLHALEVAA